MSARERLQLADELDGTPAYYQRRLAAGRLDKVTQYRPAARLLLNLANDQLRASAKLRTGICCEAAAQREALGSVLLWEVVLLVEALGGDT